ncbi:MCE family protein [Mycolicibacter sinensis]|jgi:phospholipid/cholesterol/gamma-HCH transport system substrate-binding protein|uniref:Mammalian cell entry protein n=1 Tax=Mycolicibacter sinensis (strain JDM601) TaxID=875328 RepID=A0A1A2EGU5_MYCSD|nr:MCE family protein [Mycolicibacter sinensis]OBG03275.1 mammalian cell entry protein [Mycolicibacter sinensis]OBG07697.1 mammalian cell entry protein [Mycolicibacter sinensis]
MTRRNARIGLAAVTALCLITGLLVAVRSIEEANRVNVVGYFENSNGIFVGDDVRILGVTVGKIDKIEAQPTRVKISFWFDDKYKVPADASAAVLSPSLVTPRTIQLTPAYTGGPTLPDGAVIPENRTAVPVEYDDLRDQLQKLTEMLQPTRPGGVSTLGEFTNTAADNLRGQGVNIRDAVIELSQAFSTLGDHSDDIFTSVRNVSTLVSALQTSTGSMRQLNRNLAAATAVLANDPNEVGNALRDLHTAIGDVRGFIEDNREALGTGVDRLSTISQAANDSVPEIKQLLHIAPNAFANFSNIYQPAQNALTGQLVINNFADPVGFICGAIQAASRLGADQAAKLCVQYMAPIAKNRAWNFAPIGENLFVGAMARPNEIDYSENWMRPDYIPPQAQPPVDTPNPAGHPAPVSVPANPATGLPGMMLPPGGGS